MGLPIIRRNAIDNKIKLKNGVCVMKKRETATAVFKRNHIYKILVKIRKLESFVICKDSSFLCFLMKHLRILLFAEKKGENFVEKII